GDEIGDDTVDADSGEEKSQPCEATDESYRKTARGTAVRNDVGQRANIEDRKIGIERFDGSANTGDGGGGVAGSTKNHGAAKRGNLGKWNVGFNAGRLIDAVVFDVADDADNRYPLEGLTGRRRAVERNTLAEGIFVGEILFGEGLVNDADLWRRLVVVGVEEAAGEQANAEGLQGIWSNAAEIDRRELTRLGHGLALDEESGLIAAEEGLLDAGEFHAGNRLNFCGELCDERAAHRFILVAVVGKREARCEHVGGRDAAVSLHDLPETASHQTRADEEDERESDLGGDEHVAK